MNRSRDPTAAKSAIRNSSTISGITGSTTFKGHPIVASETLGAFADTAA